MSHHDHQFDFHGAHMPDCQACRIAELEAALAEARTALEPFAAYNDAREAAVHRGRDTSPLLIASPKKGATRTITEGDVRRASAALAKIQAVRP